VHHRLQGLAGSRDASRGQDRWDEVRARAHGTRVEKRGRAGNNRPKGCVVNDDSTFYTGKAIDNALTLLAITLTPIVAVAFALLFYGLCR
jgi:hypothetical protein